MRARPDPVRIARGVGRGFTVMLLAGLAVVGLAGLLGPATGVMLTVAAMVAFASSAWDAGGPAEGALAGAGTYVVFLPLVFLGEGEPPSAMLVAPLLLGASAVGAAVGWWRTRGSA